MKDKNIEVEEEEGTLIGEGIFNLLVKVTRKVTGELKLDVEVEKDSEGEQEKGGESTSSLTLSDVHQKVNSRPKNGSGDMM